MKRLKINELEMVGHAVVELGDGWFFSTIERAIDEFEVGMWKEKNDKSVKKLRLLQNITLGIVINLLVRAVTEPSIVYEGLPKGGE